MSIQEAFTPARLARHPWEMPWRLLLGLWAFRCVVFVLLWQSHGGTAIGASHSLTVQALFDVVAWIYRRRHSPPMGFRFVVPAGSGGGSLQYSATPAEHPPRRANYVEPVEPWPRDDGHHPGTPGVDF